MDALSVLSFKTRSLVIGAGEIGTALYKVIRKHNDVFVRDKSELPIDRIDILHIAFPHSKEFVKQVTNYMEFYDPKLVIIYSTLPVGTCAEIGDQIVHSPVEGKHPELAKSIELSPRWLGSKDQHSLDMALYFWRPYVQTIRTMPSARYTEFLKLRSTAKYGINLAWTDYEVSIAEELGMDPRSIKDFDRDYNQLYLDLKMPDFQRYILDPPHGVIGGHCVVPNAEMLDEQFPHPLVKQITTMKEKGGEQDGKTEEFLAQADQQ